MKAIFRLSGRVRVETVERLIRDAGSIVVVLRDSFQADVVGWPIGVAPASTGVATDVLVLNTADRGLRVISLATVRSIEPYRRSES